MGSVLLAHADRRRVIPPDYRPVVTRKNGDVLPMLLVDGFVAGVWRPLDGQLEVRAFRRLTDDDWGALDTEARDLSALVAGRDPGIYGRYGHWWQQLPAVEVRRLTE